MLWIDIKSLTGHGGPDLKMRSVSMVEYFFPTNLISYISGDNWIQRGINNEEICTRKQENDKHADVVSWLIILLLENGT